MLDLGENLRFQRQYDSLPDGIYKLEHLPEYQTLLLEDQDSLWVRINAAAFDESMVYSGVGASKNNFSARAVFKTRSRSQLPLFKVFEQSTLLFNAIIDSLLLEKKQLWIQMDSLKHI